MVFRKRCTMHLLALAVALSLPAVGVMSAQHAPPRPEVNTDAAGVAVGGHDVVAYFTESKAVAGRSDVTATHDGSTCRFATAANRDALF